MSEVDNEEPLQVGSNAWVHWIFRQERACYTETRCTNHDTELVVENGTLMCPVTKIPVEGVPGEESPTWQAMVLALPKEFHP